MRGTTILTDRQADILEFVGDAIHDGLPPTLREIADAFGLSSSHSVACHLQLIERKGYVQRREMVSRGIRLTAQGQQWWAQRKVVAS